MEVVIEELQALERIPGVIQFGKVGASIRFSLVLPVGNGCQ